MGDFHQEPDQSRKTAIRRGIVAIDRLQPGGPFVETGLA